MTNPKIQSGPVASSTYPTKPGEIVKKATNDKERRKASILTHRMNNPPGVKNCHLIDILEDEVGPQGVPIQPNKQFDSDAQWNYVEGLLEEKVDIETATPITHAHHRLPELFRQIKTDSTINYRFKYDCIDGKYLYTDLERNLKKKYHNMKWKSPSHWICNTSSGEIPKNIY
jgi:hypothetical protein